MISARSQNRETVKPYFFRRQIYCVYYVLPTTIPLSWNFPVPPPCRSHPTRRRNSARLAILIFLCCDPTLFSRAHLLSENRTIRGIICAVTLFIGHLYWCLIFQNVCDYSIFQLTDPQDSIYLHDYTIHRSFHFSFRWISECILNSNILKAYLSIFMSNYFLSYIYFLLLLLLLLFILYLIFFE